MIGQEVTGVAAIAAALPPSGLSPEGGSQAKPAAANAHTPLPWVAHSGAYPYGWKGDIFAKDAKSIMDATHIARCNPKKPGHQFIDELHAIAWKREQAPIVEANATFIVRACNSHYELLEALRACRDQFDFYAAEHRKAEKHEKAATNERFAFLATQAISKAESK